MTNNSNWQNEKRSREQTGRLLTGVFLVIGGIAYLFKDSFLFPNWLFTWPMILIAIGLITGFKHQFSNNAWWILILIGSYFLADDIFPDLFDRHYFWPIIIIVIGLIMIFKPKRRWYNWDDQDNMGTQAGGDTSTGITSDTAPASTQQQSRKQASAEDFLNTVSILGGTKKSIFSKNFKGGKVTCIMGGSEINLLQADFTGTAVIELTVLFGGCGLIIPSNWQLHIETAPILGGVDDKRTQPMTVSSDKVLVLKGTVLAGGVEIKSY
ncbi:MAG TPA: hypothetical protein VFN30_09695 [Chitinophagaceae bacterium]|nr:hypothetical protein [Chitinophagaceae bacterium]